MKKLCSINRKEQLDILLDFSMGKVRLFMWVASDQFTYFMPLEDPGAARLAEAGMYELISTEVVERLERAVNVDSNQYFSIGGYGGYRSTDSVLSPDGEKGWIGRRELYALPNASYDPFQQPISRVFFELPPTEGIENSQFEPGNFPPTPEFSAVMEYWQRYGENGRFNIKKEAVIKELEDKGFSPVSAKAIDRICRGSKERGGRKSSD